MKRFSVSNDSGLIALVDPDAYQGFVSENWTWESICGHFADAMRQGCLLIWGTGMEHDWKIDVSLTPVDTRGFREVVGTIRSTKGRLLATSYDNLTMVAQFQNERLPQRNEIDNIIAVDTGEHRCRIIQLSDPESDGPFREKTNFIYEIIPAEGSEQTWVNIPWGPV